MTGDYCSFTGSAVSDRGNASLFTAKTVARNPSRNRETKAIVLGDEGSQQSFVSMDLAKHLGMRPKCTKRVCIGTLNNNSNNKPKTELRSVYEVELDCIDGSKLCLPLVGWEYMPTIQTPLVRNAAYELEKQSDTPTLISLERHKPDILIGADMLYCLDKRAVRSLNGGATVYGSKIGYGIVGRLRTNVTPIGT